MFSPPAHLTDFSSDEQREKWHQLVSAWFDGAVKSGQRNVKGANGQQGTVQFYNPATRDPGGKPIAQPIMWNAFPKELLSQYGRARALIEADRLQTLSQYQLGYNKPIHSLTPYRPQNEYCEWHVVRDPNTNKIVKITFSSEPPEYWRALFGDDLPIDKETNVQFPENRKTVLEFYREFVSPHVQMDDLICTKTIPGLRGQSPFAVKGAYNMYNKWNTTHGIAHLCSPPNALQAEIQLGADATILYADSAGKPVALPEPLICCALYGGPDRNSDPTIGASVNALARLGALITLADPVGLYMDHVDTSGWAYPDGTAADDCVRVLRGDAQNGMVERLEIEVPAARKLVVGDITIGGVNVRFGGQAAECITVKLIGMATKIGSVKNAPIHCAGRCCIDPHNAAQLSGVSHAKPVPPGMIHAFEVHGALHQTLRFSPTKPPFRQVRWINSQGN